MGLFGIRRHADEEHEMTRMQFLQDICDVAPDEWRERDHITKKIWSKTRIGS